MLRTAILGMWCKLMVIFVQLAWLSIDLLFHTVSFSLLSTFVFSFIALNRGITALVMRQVCRDNPSCNDSQINHARKHQGEDMLGNLHKLIKGESSAIAHNRMNSCHLLGHRWGK